MNLLYNLMSHVLVPMFVLLSSSKSVVHVISDLMRYYNYVGSPFRLGLVSQVFQKHCYNVFKDVHLCIHAFTLCLQRSYIYLLDHCQIEITQFLQKTKLFMAQIG